MQQNPRHTSFTRSGERSAADTLSGVTEVKVNVFLLGVSYFRKRLEARRLTTEAQPVLPLSFILHKIDPVHSLGRSYILCAFYYLIDVRCA